MGKVKISELSPLPIDKRVDDTFIIPTSFNDGSTIKTCKIVAKDLKDYVDKSASEKYSLAIGDKNSFSINGTTYSLVIENNKLFISQYVPTSWENVVLTKTTENTSVPASISSLEYDSSYSNITLTAYPFTSLTYSVTNTTNLPIVLTGIEYKENGNTLTYIYGGSVTISNGVANSNGEQLEYSTEINGTIELTNVSETSIVTKESGEITGGFVVTASCPSQTINVYYHEKGKSFVTSKTISNTSSISLNVPDPYKRYFVWYSTSEINEGLSDIKKVGNTSNPSSIRLNSPAGQYAFIAITNENPKFSVGGFVGGFKFLEEDTYYSDNTVYYVYRTENTGITGEVKID